VDYRHSKTKNITITKFIKVGAYWGCLIFVASSLISTFKLKERQEDRLKKTQQEVLGLEQENEKLREEIAYRQTNEYIEQVAREKLRMTKDGEEIIIVPTPLPQQNDLPGKTSGNKNILQIIFDKLKNAIKSKKNRQSDP